MSKDKNELLRVFSSTRQGRTVSEAIELLSAFGFQVIRVVENTRKVFKRGEEVISVGTGGDHIRAELHKHIVSACGAILADEQRAVTQVVEMRERVFLPIAPELAEYITVKSDTSKTALARKRQEAEGAVSGYYTNVYSKVLDSLSVLDVGVNRITDSNEIAFSAPDAVLSERFNYTELTKVQVNDKAVAFLQKVEEVYEKREEALQNLRDLGAKQLKSKSPDVALFKLPKLLQGVQLKIPLTSFSLISSKGESLIRQATELHILESQKRDTAVEQKAVQVSQPLNEGEVLSRKVVTKISISSKAVEAKKFIFTTLQDLFGTTTKEELYSGLKAAISVNEQVSPFFFDPEVKAIPPYFKQNHLKAMRDNLINLVYSGLQAKGVEEDEALKVINKIDKSMQLICREIQKPTKLGWDEIAPVSRL